MGPELFDLTNTYFESDATHIAKAQGTFQGKTRDAPLVTLALVVDGNGALKGAEV